MLLILLSACSPYVGMDDPWSAAREACPVSEPMDRLGHLPYPKDDLCLAQLAEDFGMDIADLRSRDEQLFNQLTEAMVLIMYREAGQLSALKEDDFVRAPLIDELRAVGGAIGATEVRHALYAFVAHYIVETVYDTEDIMAYEDGVLFAGGPLELGAQPAGVLFHEAAHAVAPRHVDCEGGKEDGCDRSWRGAYGLQAGVYELWRANLPDGLRDGEDWIEDFEEERDHSARRVLSDRPW